MTLNLELKSRIYGGFGILVALGLVLALFAAWQLHRIDLAAGQLSAIADANRRIVAIGRNLEVMRRAILGLQFQNDAQSLKDGDAAAKAALELLDVTAGRTVSEERKRVYLGLKANVMAFQAKRAALMELAKSIDKARREL